MTPLVMLLAVLVLVSFAAGSIWNVRSGRVLMRWMQGGLPLLGERTTVRWLGTTAIEMVIRNAHSPFEQVTAVIFLEPRDVPWMWAISRGRGRRDTIIIRARLRSAPTADIEMLDPRSWSGRDALRSIAAGQWTIRAPGPAGALPVYYKSPAVLERADELLELARRSGLVVRRLSVRRTEPHLQIHVAPPATVTPASEFFAAVRALGQRASA